MFADREQELETLEQLHKKDTGSLIVLYGRRRVGKTTLIQHFLQGKEGVYFLATEESDMENQRYFRGLVADFLHNDLLREAEGAGWERVTTLFCEVKRKIVLVIDEFQYLCKVNPGFSSLFQRLYDTLLKPAGVMVILSGSYIRMMESETLNYSSPLYGRRDGQIKLGPIPYAHCRDFFPGKTADEVFLFYTLTGGVPRYMKMLQGEATLESAMENGLFNPRSMLFEEPLFLLSQEVRDIGSYFTLLKTVAAGNRRPSAISAVMQVPQTSLSKVLATLTHQGILERRVPVTEANPEKGKRVLYRIADPFLAFWFRFVAPYRSALALNDKTDAWKEIEASFGSGHVAWIYEDVCLQKLWEMSTDGLFGCLLQRAGNWWNQTTEIDLVGIGTDGRTRVLADCKYHHKPIDSSVLNELRIKGSALPPGGKGAQDHYVLFSRSGFDRNLLAMAREDALLHLVQYPS